MCGGNQRYTGARIRNTSVYCCCTYMQHEYHATPPRPLAQTAEKTNVFLVRFFLARPSCLLSTTLSAMIYTCGSIDPRKKTCFGKTSLCADTEVPFTLDSTALLHTQAHGHQRSPQLRAVLTRGTDPLWCVLHTTTTQDET